MEEFEIQKLNFNNNNNNNNTIIRQLFPSDIVWIGKKYYDSLPNSSKDLFSIVAIETETLRPQNIKEWLKFWQWKKKRYFKKDIVGYQLMFKGNS